MVGVANRRYRPAMQDWARDIATEKSARQLMQARGLFDRTQVDSGEPAPFVAIQIVLEALALA